jgi:hypothetical protein
MYRLALAVVLLLLPSVVVADVTGKPRVVDGDTIHIGKTKIRLHGIDAPEMKQTVPTAFHPYRSTFRFTHSFLSSRPNGSTLAIHWRWARFRRVSRCRI